MIPYKKDQFDTEAQLDSSDPMPSGTTVDVNGPVIDESTSRSSKKKFYATLPMSSRVRKILDVLKIAGLLVGLAVFICLTLIVIVNGMKYFAYYSSEATITQTVLHRNRSIQLPPPTVCVQFDSSEFSYGDYESIETLEEQLREAMEKKYFAKIFGNWPEELVRSAQPDADLAQLLPLILLTARMIVDVSRAEQPFFANSSRRWSRFSDLLDLDAFTSSEEKQMRERSALVLKFFNNKLKMSDDYVYEQTNIIKSIGSLMCTVMAMKVKSNHIKPRLLQDIFREIRPCYKDNVTWLGLIPMSFKQEELVCVKIKGPRNFRFSSSKDVTTIMFNPTNLYNDSIASSANEAYVDFTGQRVTNSIKSDILLVPFKKETTASVSIAADYEAMNLARTPCNPAATSAACKRSCKAKVIMAKCGCWPLSMFYGYEGNGVGYCSERKGDGAAVNDEPFSLRGSQNSFLPRTNKSCTELVKTELNSTWCQRQCPEKCGHMMLSFDIHQTPLDDDADNETTVNFQVDRFSYLRTQEIPQTDLTDLVTDLTMDVGILILFVMVICWTLRCLWRQRHTCLPSGRADDLQVIFRKQTTGREIEIHPSAGLVNPTAIVDALKSLEGQEYLKSFFKTFVVEANENKYETIPPRR